MKLLFDENGDGRMSSTEIFGELAAVGSFLGGVGGLFGGGGGGDNGTIKQEPWEGLKPYLIGQSDYRPDMNLPISSDWLYWNYMMGQGMPIGPPPPMLANDMRYTGQGVYDPPFQFQPARLSGPAYGDEGPHGAKPPDTGLFNPGDKPVPSDYPSGGDPGGILQPAPEPAPQPPPSGGVDTGLLDAMAKAEKTIAQWHLRNSMTEDPTSAKPPPLSEVTRFWQQNPNATRYISQGYLDAIIDPAKRDALKAKYGIT